MASSTASDAWSKGFRSSNEIAKKGAAQPATPALPADRGANNKLVTVERAAELRDRLKDLPNPYPLNTGIDPQILAVGAELAIHNIKAGARRFQDFAKAIATHMGMPVPSLRKYLRGWYNGSPDTLEDAGESVLDMHGADPVAGYGLWPVTRTLDDWTANDILLHRLWRMNMEFKHAYLTAMYEQAPQMYKELKQSGAMESHLKAKVKEAYDLYDQLTDKAEKMPNGIVMDLQVQRQAEEQVFAQLIEFSE